MTTRPDTDVWTASTRRQLRQLRHLRRLGSPRVTTDRRSRLRTKVFSRLPARRWLVTVTGLTTLLGSGAILALPAQAVAPNIPSGWHRSFVDNFTGAQGERLDPNRWIYTTGTSYPGGPANFGTGEVETMTSSTANVAQDGDGHLLITPRRDAQGNWTSGRVETRDASFQPRAGEVMRVEARMQLPKVSGAAAHGYWPAFWMLGAPYRQNRAGWPAVGEIDIMENVNGLNKTFATMHCGVFNYGPCEETTGLGGSRPCPGSTCQNGFHTYSVEWNRAVTPERMDFKVDGQLYNRVTADRVDAATWANATNHGYFLILNVAIGGGFPDGYGGADRTATVPGVPLVVDYVQVISHPGRATQVGPLAGERHEVEFAEATHGITYQEAFDVGGGQNAARLADGDWLLLRGVRFGATPGRSMTARVASALPPGVAGYVEVRIDNVNAAPAARVAVGGTGGWQSWQTVRSSPMSVSGTHDVYVRFTSAQPGDFANLNWITFSR